MDNLGAHQPDAVRALLEAAGVTTLVGEVCEQDAAGWFAHCGYPLKRAKMRRDDVPLEGST